MFKKSFITLVVVALVSISSFAANNLNKSNLFRDAKMKDISAMSKQERKPILIYVGANNCLQSQKMNETLENKEVTAFLKSKFVCKSLNAGNFIDQFVATNYGVTQIPCFIYINGNGEVIYKSIGFKKGVQMIDEAKKALLLMRDQNGRII